MSIHTSYHNRATTIDEQRLYDHLLTCAAQESPDELLARFRALFIEGVGYPDPVITDALDTILATPDVDHYFRYILNRCCYILINRWQAHHQLQQSIPHLVRLFADSPSQRVTEFSRSRSIRRLRQVSQKFTATEQYLTMGRLARVIEAKRQYQRSEPGLNQPLGTFISRYPYLYEHCLLTEDSDLEQHRHVRRIQYEAQHNFEVDLSHYVTYRVRQAQIGKGTAPNLTTNFRSVPNPTLLNDKELVASINQFAYRRAGHSYQDLAQRFTLQSRASMTYREFKGDLYDYICGGVDPGYGCRQFNRLLDQNLKNTFADSDDKQVNDFLIVRTCSQLLNFLVVDVSASKQHYIFIDLINNLGPILTTGLLLRILLFCRKVKPQLERRFSLLFNHYETVKRDSIEWLIKMLENLNIAFSLNFGSLDLSHVMGTGSQTTKVAVVKYPL
ncbi:hypothetical protein C7271_15180 [filamentous cyanobacterium CCP5]|nr:hypothetical protein C7271_15180 [filamentous cyanobacterium CCP5]